MLLLGVLACHRPALAQINTINFDDYLQGTLTYAAADRYRSVGVVFSRGIPIYSVAAVEANWWVQIFQAGGGTLPNALPLSSTVDSRLSIEMSFVRPGTSTPATTDLAGVMFADSEVGSTMAKFEAFDANGTLIASSTPATPSSCTAVVQLNTRGIARVRFTDTGDGVEVDNIFFRRPTVLRPAIVSGSGAFQANGQFQFQLTSDAGTVLEVLASTNLTTWETIGTVTNDAGAVWFTDPTTNLVRRFYRTRQQ